MQFYEWRRAPPERRQELLDVIASLRGRVSEDAQPLDNNMGTQSAERDAVQVTSTDTVRVCVCG